MKIYCFVNGHSPEWYPVLAIREDGHCLAQHLSSSLGWAQADIGITSESKHDLYREHCPDGYELVWVDEKDVLTHPGLKEAYLKNQELAAAAEPITE